MEIFVTVDIDPNSGMILGTQETTKAPIEIDRPVLIKHPIFTEHGVTGVTVDEKRKLKGLKPVTRTEDGDIWNFAGTMPLLSARWALLNPKTGVHYTNAE